MEERNNWEGREVEEDKLLNKNVLNLIEELHGKIEKIEKHFRVGGEEVDAIIYCGTKRRRIGIELKEADIEKAISQAINRRNFFNYFYIVLHCSKSWLGYIIYYLFRKNELSHFFNYKIGLIIVNNEEAFLVFPSHFIKVGVEKFLNTKNNNL